MADDLDTSTVAEGATTPAPAEPVEATNTSDAGAQPEAPAAKEPMTAEDVWSFDDVADDEPAAEKAEEADAAEPEKKEEKQEDEKDAKDDDEKSLEEQLLEEAFSDEPDKGESEEDDIDKLDPQKVIDGITNKSRREWAERNAKKAEVVKSFQFDDTPIADVAAKLEEISPQRFVELSQHAAYRLVDANPDDTFKRAYAIKMLQKNPTWDPHTAEYPSLDDLIANGTVAKTQPDAAAQTKPSLPLELAEVTAELDKALGWDWRDPELDENFVDERELAMAKTMRALEAKASEESIRNKDLDEKLKGLTEGAESVEQRMFMTEVMKTVNDYRSEIESSLVPVIAKVTGLEISPNDTPKMKRFKENKMLLFTGTPKEKADNIGSPYERFAFNESSVRAEIETIQKRISAIQGKEANARLVGNKAEEEMYHRDAQAEKLPLGQLLLKAAREYAKEYIDPDLDVIGQLSSDLTEPRKEASQRVEVTSNGSPAPARPPKKNYETADDVWGGMVEDARREEQLRAEA